MGEEWSEEQLIEQITDLIKEKKIAGDSIVYILIQGCTCTFSVGAKTYTTNTGGKILDASGLSSEKITMKDKKVNNNIVLVFDKTSGVIYSNKHNSKDQTDVVDFLESESGAKVVPCDFPHVESARAKTGKIDSFESACKLAIKSSENENESDVAF